MKFQLIVVFLAGLAASTYALDLSHANKRSTEVEPRIFGFINDLYAQVVYPPLNHVVTNLALLGAQFLAGLSQTGIPAPGGRTLHPSDAQLRGFFDDLWNNAVRPPLENALSGFSLLAAQLLAGIATNGIDLGKRDLTEAEMRGFTDDLLAAFNNVFANVVQKPLEDALAGGALMLAQVLAGVGTNGINLASLVGKRDVTDLTARQAELRGIFDSFGQTLLNGLQGVWSNIIQNPLEQALQGGALMLAQVLAGVGTNGINLASLVGKRDVTDLTARQAELRGIFDSFGQTLLNGLQGVWSNIIQNPLEQALQGGALMLAQVLAGVGTNGLDLSALVGKRDVTVDGRGIFDNILGQASGIYSNQIKPILENALSATALHLAGVLANFSQNGLGRR